MATPVDYVEFICEQIHDFQSVRYKKMFGDYMVYVNENPYCSFATARCM